LGSSAERAVARHLVSLGFEILALNLRINRYELDIVARKDELVVVVEVRARGKGAWTTAFGSMDGAKRRRIRLAGERLWNRSFKRDPSVERMRFDAAAVTFVNGEAVVEYVPAAF
jgi:putative endonuclease